MYEDTNGLKYYYVGQFKDGKKDGVGILVFEEGLIHEGYYKDDNLNGPCRLISGAGLYFICEYKNGEKECYGEYYHQDGTTYKGQFKESCYHGEGTLTHPDGKVESGLWEYHKFKG